MLEVYHMRCLRRILKTSWDEEREDKIINLSVRDEFNNIDSIKIFIVKRLLFFREDHKNEMKMCSCTTHFYLKKIRGPTGRPNMTTCYSFLNDIE